MLTSPLGLAGRQPRIAAVRLDLVHGTAETLERLILGHSRILFSPQRVGRRLHF
jgi:hypothetical protein